MGLFDLPNDEPPTSGYQLVECASDEPDIEIWVENRFLSPECVRDGSLVFNIEGYGRFRLWLRESV